MGVNLGIRNQLLSLLPAAAFLNIKHSSFPRLSICTSLSKVFAKPSVTTLWREELA